MLDPTTAGLYIAAGTGATARSQAVVTSLGSGTLTLKLYDAGAEVYSGTFAGPLTVDNDGGLVLSARTTGSASGSGTPDAATWTARISNADGRWIGGTVGPTGRFQLSGALTAGRAIALAATIAPQSGIVTPPGPTPGYTLAPLGQPRIMLSNPAVLTKWEALRDANDPTYARFKTWVDTVKNTGGAAYGFSPSYASLFGRLTGDSSYHTFAVAWEDAIVATAEADIAAGLQPAWVYSNSNYLYVIENIGVDLGITYDWSRDYLTESQKARWIAYGNQAIFNTWNPSLRAWGGNPFPKSGWAQDNPANNFHYIFLGATMFWAMATYGDNPDAETWLDYFRNNRIERLWINDNVRVGTTSIGNGLDQVCIGGGSTEGTGYGAAMRILFQLFRWWEQSTGERIADLGEHTHRSFSWWISCIAPTLDTVLFVGDHNRPDPLNDYEMQLLQQLILLYPTDPLAGIAKTMIVNSSKPIMGAQTEIPQDFYNNLNDITGTALSSAPLIHYAPGAGFLNVRSSWESSGTLLGLLCGPFYESHSHPHAGSFVLFKHDWLAFDAVQAISGVGHAVIDHNLVRIEQGGVVVNQPYYTDSSFDAISDSSVYTYALMNATNAYEGRSAVVKVEREMVYLKPDCVVVFDRAVTTGSGIERIWGLNLPTTPSISGAVASVTYGGGQLDVHRIAPTGLTSEVNSFRIAIRYPEYASGKRLDARHNTGNESLFLHVLGLDSNVVSAVASDATGQTGVLVTLNDGSYATIRFNNATTGGSIDYRASGGSVLVNETFTTTVDVSYSA